MLELVLVAAVIFVIVMIAKALAFILKSLLGLVVLCFFILIFMALVRMLELV